MLIFEKIPMFKAIYDCAKKIYPELEEANIVVDFTTTTDGVQLLEGTEEDAGKFKIAVNNSDDIQIVGSFFMAGLTMLVYYLRTGDHVHPITDEYKARHSEYSNIADAIANACVIQHTEEYYR